MSVVLALLVWLGSGSFFWGFVAFLFLITIDVDGDNKK
jgi:hypothetical protein